MRAEKPGSENTISSDKSAEKVTRPFSIPSKVRSLATEVLDRSLKITWLEPSDVLEIAWL